MDKRLPSKLVVWFCDLRLRVPGLSEHRQMKSGFIFPSRKKSHRLPRMRWSGLRFIFIGIFSFALVGCNSSPQQAGPQRLPIEPPDGWRLVRQATKPESYGAIFLPKQRAYQEKMWVTIVHKPDLQSKSIDDLFTIFRPVFICQNKNLNILKEDANEILFEEQDLMCYGRNYRYTIARLTKGEDRISFYAYRADMKDLPDGRRDFIMKALTSAALDTASPKPPAAANSVAANANPAVANNSH